MTNNILAFNAAMGIRKMHSEQGCPFCQLDHLQNVIQVEGEKVLLKNKYPTLEKTTQLVLIESAKHNGDVVNYEPSEWEAILSFALECWEAQIKSAKYASVLLYKNFGPESGGTQQHPHMQIVGLKQTDGYANIQKENFMGPIIQKEAGVLVNASEQPIMGFFEINVIWTTQTQLPLAAVKIQQTVKYVLNRYHQGRCRSYNLFFYQVDGRYICKVVPRFTTSPYFVGYRLGQKFNAVSVENLKHEYLQYCSE